LHCALTINSDDLLDKMEHSNFGQVIIWKAAVKVARLAAGLLHALPAGRQSHMGI
jgi:hypothetical protein